MSATTVFVAMAFVFSATYVLLTTEIGERLLFAIGRWLCSISGDGHDFGPWRRETAIAVELRRCARCSLVEQRPLYDGYVELAWPDALAASFAAVAAEDEDGVALFDQERES